MNRTLILSFALVCSGCAYEWPDETQGDYLCNTDGDCAAQFTCDLDSGQCVAEESSDASDASDSSDASDASDSSDASDASDSSDASDPGNCPEGQHTVGNICYDHNDITHCFDGSDSVDCTTMNIPEHSIPACMGTGDAQHPAFECSYECTNGYEDQAGTCVGPAGMVLVGAGVFHMGCNGAEDAHCDMATEEPDHEVTLGDFWIDIYEVQAGDYKECVETIISGESVCSYNGYAEAPNQTYGSGSSSDHPINYVSYEEAKTYCEWKGKELPTEAQWEKAARGDDFRVYPWGSSPEPSCNDTVMFGCGPQAVTQPVTNFSDNMSPYGAHHMVGNVFEWVKDYYLEDYYTSGAPSSGDWVEPQGPNAGPLRVIKGGGFNSPGSNDFQAPGADNFMSPMLRASARGYSSPTTRQADLGFRCVRGL
jgi:sulfatase modifying factor 1